jgi:hypothetical protein
VEDCIGVDEYPGNGNGMVYPNPSDGLLHISVTDIYGDYEVCLISLQGQVALQKIINGYSNSESDLDLTALPAGTYLLRIRAEGVNVMKRLVIN